MTFRYAWKRSIPVMAGYIVLGMGFGMLLGAKGYGVFWAIAMSVFIYAGSMQFVAIDLITGGASLISAALMTLMVNARHLFYGISMVERYKDTKPYKPYLIFALTDETYSLVCSGDVPEGVEEKKYFFLVSLLDQMLPLRQLRFCFLWCLPNSGRVQRITEAQLPEWQHRYSACWCSDRPRS